MKATNDVFKVTIMSYHELSGDPEVFATVSISTANEGGKLTSLGQTET